MDRAELEFGAPGGAVSGSTCRIGLMKDLARHQGEVAFALFVFIAASFSC